MSAMSLAPKRGLDPTVIERELARLWRRPEERLGGALPTRTSVMTLMVYASAQTGAERIATALGQIAGRHPSRAIVAIVESGRSDSSLGIQLSAQCDLLDGGGKSACYETVTLHLGRGAINHLPGIVLPLLLPNLPIFVWWPDEAALFDDRSAWMLDAADRLIVDLSIFQAPALALGQLASMTRTWRHRCRISDLCWTRLTPWRQLVAQFFDVPDQRPFLARLSEVNVVYGATPGGGPANPLQALLFVGWLAKRLGWKLPAGIEPPRGKDLQFRLRAPYHWVAISIQSGPPSDAAPGNLWSVELKTDMEDERSASFSIVRDGQQACAAVTAAVGDLPLRSRVVRFEVLDSGKLLGVEFGRLGHDLLYEEALFMAAGLVGFPGEDLEA